MLFNELTDKTLNQLPKDGTVHYYGSVFNGDLANHYFERLMHEIAWKNDKVIIFGKHIITKRKVAWYASKSYEYTYSNVVRRALLWTPLLLEIKTKVEWETQQVYNSCLLNLYHTGSEGMAWHSDDEKELISGGSIASVSFGAKRKFALKHKSTSEKVSFDLSHGDLLEMKGETQLHWLHSLPPTKKVDSPRINLTFRQMKSQ